MDMIKEPDAKKKSALRTEVLDLLSTRNRLLTKDKLDNDDQKKLDENTKALCNKLGRDKDDIQDILDDRDALRKNDY